MKATIVGEIKDSISRSQREPFDYSQKALFREISLQFEQVSASGFLEIEEACRRCSSEAIFLLPSWCESPDEVERTVERIYKCAEGRKLIFIDPWAQASTKYFNLLPYVDKFLKRQCYKDLTLYDQDFVGGSIFTDFLANCFGFDFSNWNVSSRLLEKYKDRVMPGWNLGTAKCFRSELMKHRFWFNRPQKNIDIFCRLSLGNPNKKEWYYYYRLEALNALKPLDQKYTVVSSGGFSGCGLVPRRQYFREMRSSRIVFSPFGWGETCWRDFEAICNNCLLIKPSMEHINTSPNIFVSGETYVSVEWDFSDLCEKCDYYLKNPDEASRIVQNARKLYEDYFREDKFVEIVKEVLLGEQVSQ